MGWEREKMISPAVEAEEKRENLIKRFTQFRSHLNNLRHPSVSLCSFDEL